MSYIGNKHHRGAATEGRPYMSYIGTLATIGILRYLGRLRLPVYSQQSMAAKRRLNIALLALLAGALAWLGIQLFRLAGADVKWTAIKLPESGKTGFTRLPPEQTGISFMNSFKDEQLTKNQLLFTGSGVAAGDFDDDGLCDLYFCKLDGPNVLYKNLGNWRFNDVTDVAGVALPDKLSTGATFADIDGDADLDLLVSGFGGMTCFQNDGNGKFTDVTRSAGLTSQLSSTTLTLADIEGDRDLDLYVANYRTTTLRDGAAIQLQTIKGQVVIPANLRDRVTFVDGALKEYGEPDSLYKNDGKGHFTQVSWTDGTFVDEDGLKLTGPPLDWGLTATFRDVDLDGDPDLYVCNDYWTPERFWINDGRGQFRAIERVALRHTCATSMGADFADLDRDGDYDFLVTDMLSRNQQLAKVQMPNTRPKLAAIGKIDDRPQYMRNTLFVNRGDGTYAEAADFAGLEASEWSWSPVFFDVDLDGYEDVIIPNGNARDVQDYDIINHIKTLNLSTVEQLQNTLLLYPPLNTADLAFRNLGDLKFEDVSNAWGIDSKTVSQGMATADLDNDGDLDVVMNNHQVPAEVYRNDGVAPRVAVRLVGASPNTQAVGARVSLLGGPVPIQFQEILCGGRYLSGCEPLLVFAAGNNSGALSLEVTWPSGEKSAVSGVVPNRIYEIKEGRSGSRTGTVKSLPPIFEDVSSLIHHTHHENEFDDFKRQPLLPKRLSRLGPGVGWHDLNGDRWDDLIIGAGKDGSIAVYLNDRKGSFSASNVFAEPTPRDQTSIVAWTRSQGESVLMTGQSNFEDGLTSGQSVLRVDFSGTRAAFAGGLADQPSSSGPMAAADIDSDGDLDLFVGGRSIPGRYPVAASSKLFLNQGPTFELDQTNNAVLASIGLVSGAVFSDIDSDGDPDLVLAIEWGAVTVLMNQNGRFVDNTAQLGLSSLKGWWNGVTTGDLDEDGRMDLVATNWGSNSAYRPEPNRDLRIYYDDFDGSGTLDTIEAFHDPEMRRYVPRRGFEAMTGGIPKLMARFPTFRAYAAAGLAEVFGPGVDNVAHLSANELRHMVFLNRGDRFEATPLPTEAQLAPAFGVSVADYDGDGHEDVFIAQNFFAANIDLPRADAGRGLWLRGDGNGSLQSIGGHETGIKVYGESRGSALADFDGDGRTDLVVTQNGALTKLYRNQRATPGLWVRLEGPPGNADGIGATLRMVYGEQLGAAREIHSGGGYWSQDSSVPVLRSEGATAIRIKWPGGKITTSTLPSGTKGIRIDSNGNLTVEAR